MNVFNQFSYVLFSLAAIAGFSFVLWRLRARWSVIVLSVIVLVSIATIGWLALRPGSPDIDDTEAARAIIASGQPTLVEFYSNYCVSCMAIRNDVDMLVARARERFGDEVNMLRIDIHTESGRALRMQYGFAYTPEFVLFDGGAEVWRSHHPPSLDDLEALVIADSPNAVTG